MLRRLICFFTIFTMLSIPCVHADTNKEAENFQKNVAMLRAFGIIDGGMGNPDSAMKREEFFGIICNMINLKSTEELISGKVLTGVDYDDLGEKEDLTYTQAAALLVNALGFRELAEREGGYPSGHLKTASNIGITKGVSAQNEIKKSEIVKMLCNACDTEIMQLTGISTGSNFSVKDGETLLVRYHDIYMIKGIVSEVKDICINKEEGMKQDGAVIAGMYMEADGTDVEPYLGMSVEAYYRQSGNDDPKLVYITESSKNDVVIVSADDIIKEETTKEKLVYTEENSERSKTVKISPVADMVYNRRGYVSYKAEDFMPEVGEVKIIDNDADGKYDCIIVTDYRTVFVDRVSAISEEIFPKYGGESIDLSEADVYSVYDTEGVEMNISEIKSNNVLFVQMSKDGKYAKITVSKNSVTGSVSSADMEEKILTIDGTEYKVNRQTYDYYETMSGEKISDSIMATGKNRIYYLDPSGRIAGYTAAEEQGYSYGLLYRRYLDDYEGKLYLIVLDEENQWHTYAAADKLKIDNDPAKSHEAAYNALDERQVLRLTFDNESKVKRIETAREIDDGKDTEYFNKITITKVYRSPNASFNSEFYLDGNLSIFTIPKKPTSSTEEDNTNNRNYYSVTGNEFQDYSNYTVTLYDVDANNRARVVLYEKNAAEKNLGNTVFLINNINYTVKGTDVLQSAEGIVVGQELSINAEDEHLFDGLGRGDLIRFHINGDGRADAIDTVQKADEKLLEGDVLSNTLASSAAAILKGTIVHVDAEEGYIKIRGTDGTRALKISGAKVAIYDKKRNRVSAADRSDIQIGDFAVILASTSAIRSITIYR